MRKKIIVVSNRMQREEMKKRERESRSTKTEGEKKEMSYFTSQWING